MVEEAQHVGQQAAGDEAGEHEVESEVADVCGAAARRRDRDPRDADHDRAHRDVLVASPALSEHPLAHEQQHEQAGCERRLHEHERREEQRDHLQRPAEHREPRAEQPAPALEQPARERDPQMEAARRLLRVHRLQRDPYAVQGRGAHGREQPEDQIEH